MQIDPNDPSNSANEDAQEHISGDLPLERYCVITVAEVSHYAKAIWTTLEEALAYAVCNIDDDIYPEAPVAVVDLDTGARLVPDFNSIQWVPEVTE